MFWVVFWAGFWARSRAVQRRVALRVRVVFCMAVTIAGWVLGGDEVYE